jgi:hypothetical protein
MVASGQENVDRSTDYWRGTPTQHSFCLTEDLFLVPTDQTLRRDADNCKPSVTAFGR